MERTGGDKPTLSIIIPAANEEAHILPCLSALLAQTGVDSREIEVIVAANGCQDSTVTLARSQVEAFDARGWPLTVLDIRQGSKIGALNTAEAEARGSARAYLDADIVMEPELLSQTLAALHVPKPVYVTGRLKVAPARSWVSRRYGALWVRLPFMAPGSAPGAGFFAVNGAGRRRWESFPDIIADDSFVRWLFAPSERVEVTAGYEWPLVEGFRALVKVRRRQDAGGVELMRLYPELAGNEQKQGMTWRHHLTLMVARPVDYLVYCAIKLAVRTKRGSSEGWARGSR